MPFKVIFDPYNSNPPRLICTTETLASAEAIVAALAVFAKQQEEQGPFYVYESWDSYRYIDLEGSFEILEKQIPSEQ